jgi:phosphoribosylformylglycinamidine synthase
MLRAVLEGMGEGAVLAAHDVSHGGVLVAVAEMVLASRPYGLGCDLDLGHGLGSSQAEANWLFAEFGGIVVEVARDRWPEFEASLSQDGVQFVRLGETSAQERMLVETDQGSMELRIDELAAAHEGDVAGLLG